MTSRCSVFAIEFEESRTRGDGDRKDLWDQVAESLAVAIELLQEMAEEAGIDVDADYDDPVIDGPRNEILERASVRYRDSVRYWFDMHEPSLEEKVSDPGLHGREGLQVVGTGPEALHLKDLIDIIMWYHTLIYVKIHRALLPDPLEGLEEMEDLPRDADGSAKVALIAIDRSTAAWSGMLEYFPEKKADILNFVRQLEMLGRATVWAFPGARGFIRPGFDDYDKSGS